MNSPVSRGITAPIVFGLGGVGRLVAALLAESGMKVLAVDRQEPAILPPGVSYRQADASDSAQISSLLKGHDACVSCLPFHLTLPLAEAAHKAGIHYFDPTEDVTTTEAIRALAKTSGAVMIPQNGLAPGFIGILGAHIAKQFDAGTTLRHIKMRVGALPQHPIGQLGYAGNWSLEGLVHEYIAACDIIQDGKKQKIPALRNAEIIRIHGVEYEAFTTSGGLGTMTDTYQGRVDVLDYKSIRYPGHLSGMKLLIEELRFRDDPDALVDRLRHALPPDPQDRVLIHASVQGEINGQQQTREIVADYTPILLAGQERTAIAWTTASSIVAVVEMVSEGTLPSQGFVKQEDIPLPDFLATRTGRLYAAHNPNLAEATSTE